MNTLTIFRIATSPLPLLFFGCTENFPDTNSGTGEVNFPSAPVANVIYSGGDIVTMAGDSIQYVEAVAIRDWIIPASGNLQAVKDIAVIGTVYRGKSIVANQVSHLDSAHSHRSHRRSNFHLTLTNRQSDTE